jgi:hypothetical protein
MQDDLGHKSWWRVNFNFPSGVGRTIGPEYTPDRDLHDRRPVAEVAMDKKASPKTDKTPQSSPEAPFATFIQLDGKSSVPSQFRTPGTFTVTRLQSPAGLPDRITKLSPLRLCRHRATRFGHQTSSFLHPSFIRFAPMSSISMHSQGAGQAVPSITFTILFLVKD